MGAVREAKKRATRERISDVATALFFERGFDRVTLEEIAAAAKVSKMTVTNYFARKEELLLDREDDLKLVSFRDAVRARPETPGAAIRELLDRLEKEKHPLARIEARSVAWWQVVRASPALQSRMRELADEAAEGLAVELGGTPLARLMGGVIVLALRTGREEAIRQIERGGSAKKANAAMRAVLEQGLAAVDALAGARPPKTRSSA